MVPGPAAADGQRTATASGFGPSMEAGNANAQANARAALVAQARPAAETCTNVSSSATHVFTAPDGSAYVFNGTATGFCAVTQPFTVYRASTRQGSASTAAAAQAAASQPARADVQAAGINCVEWLVSYRLLFRAPARNWWTYEATASAFCAQ